MDNVKQLTVEQATELANFDEVCLEKPSRCPLNLLLHWPSITGLPFNSGDWWNGKFRWLRN